MCDLLATMAAESEAAVATNSDETKSPTLTNQVASVIRPNFGHIRLDISNSVLPLEKLSATPSNKDGLNEEIEMQIRSLGCEMIQLAGKLLKLPQVRMKEKSLFVFVWTIIMRVILCSTMTHHDFNFCFKYFFIRQ